MKSGLIKGVLLTAVFTFAVSFAAADDEVYDSSNNFGYGKGYVGDKTLLPDLVRILPAPPAFDSPLFFNDWLQFEWGLSVRRDYPMRTAQALADAPWGIMYVKQFESAFGREISKETTPELWKLISEMGEDLHNATDLAKQHYFRTRPFVKFNEHTILQSSEASLKDNGSYPSGHTPMGLGLALVLAEINPAAQDTILSRGYQFGQSRVIGGFHYQSDVEAGRLSACMTVARLHADTAFLAQLERARQEFLNGSAAYDSKVNADKSDSYVNDGDLPDLVRMLPAPPAKDSPHFFNDWSRYQWGKGIRDTGRGRQAVDDARYDLIYSSFSPAFGRDITPENTPCLWKMLTKAFNDLSASTTASKRHYSRKRPFVEYDEPTSVPSQEMGAHGSSSYPSRHAAVGFGIALLLTEINPDAQDTILSRGYQYGVSRVISGFHYQSDVDAGYMAAAATVARLHADPVFRNDMAKAKAEFKNGGSVYKADRKALRIQKRLRARNIKRRQTA